MPDALLTALRENNDKWLAGEPAENMGSCGLALVVRALLIHIEAAEDKASEGEQE
ncbi:unnamed protein product [marine sediment metagenome]|uniref:Uncharacterized protein n=1 Tax=marine sediment metagenome TaxID=412755 RepID=X0V9Y0_9ZZZZ